MMLTTAERTALDSNISLSSGVVTSSSWMLHSRRQAFESSCITITAVFAISVYQEEL